ncbi:hypothetical protein D3C80_1762820 [compost metagenome]
MQAAVLAVVDLAGAFVDLQGDAQRALLQEVVEKGAQHREQAVADSFVHGRAASRAHAQVGVEKTVVTLAIGHRAVRCGIGQNTGAAGGEHGFAAFVTLLQHAVGQGPAQAGHIRLLFKVGGVEQYQVRHGGYPA